MAYLREETEYFKQTDFKFEMFSPNASTDGQEKRVGSG